MAGLGATLSEANEALFRRLVLKDSVAEFYNREADLLDDRNLTGWLDLFAEGATYLVPLQQNVKYGEWERENRSGPLDVAWISDTKETLSQRVEQLQTGIHWAEEPVSRSAHLVTNIRILGQEPTDGEPDRLETRSRVLVYRNRVERETDMFVCIRNDVLVQGGEDWLIADRTVLIAQNVLQSKNLTVFF